MENQINTSSQNTQQIEQNPVIQPPINPVPTKPKINYWMITSILLTIVLVGLVIVYFVYLRTIPQLPNSNNNVESPLTNNSETPSLVATGTEQFKSNQIRLGGLQFTYPEQWTPIFASPNDGKSVIYFANSQKDVQTLISCASSASCSNYPLKLEDFTNSAVWQNTSVEDFIKQVKPEIMLDKLLKTTINGREAWTGYTNAEKTNYQLVIVTSTDQQKSFASIIANTSSKENSLLDEYVSKTPSIIVSGFQTAKQNELSTKKGYTLELQSSLNTENDQLITTLVDSFLAPKNSTKKYNYFLFTESTKSSNGQIGGPNYPKGNPLNYKYFLLTDNNLLKDGNYGTSQISMKVASSSNMDLGSYLADQKYCQQDSDCQYRANFCSIGAYNPYHQYAGPWGCGPADLEGLGNSNDLTTSMGCQTDVEVKYDAIKCVSNSCKTINPKPVCKQ